MGAPADDDLTPIERERLNAHLRFRTRLVLGNLAFLIIALTVAAVVIDRQHPDNGKRGLAFAFAILIPLVMTAAMVPLLRRQVRRAGPTRRLVVSGSRQDIRRVSKLIRKGRTVAPQDREIASALVASSSRQWWLGWLYLGFGVAWLLFALLDHDGRRVGHVVFGLAYLALGGVFLEVTRRGRRKAAEQGIGGEHPDDG